MSTPRRSFMRLAAVGAISIALSSCSTAAPSPLSTLPSTAGSTTAPSTTPVDSALASSAGFHPAYSETECPEDILAGAIAEVGCGFLTVLEDRSKPAGRTIRLFVTRAEPPGGSTTADPGLGAGGELGARDEPGGSGGGAQRIHRSLYNFDRRGIGYSEPTLDCPEVKAVGPELAGLRLREPAYRSTLLVAVQTCHDRLVGEGIDLAAYDMAANAADYEDLRVALGIPIWNVGANLNGSRIALEYLRRYPAAARSFIADSPALPTPDVFTIAPEAFDLAIQRLSAACAAQAACAGRVPDLGEAIQSAIAELEDEPVTVEVGGTVQAVTLGHPITVVIDGAALLRFIRARLGAGGGSMAETIVTTVLDALEGTLGPDHPLAISLASDAGPCLGFLPGCERMNYGALYSLVCADLGPSMDHARLAEAIDGRAAYGDVFDPSPLVSVCEAWDVAPAQADTSPLPDDLPTLMFRGWFDPYSTPVADIRSAYGDRRNLYIVEVPEQSYNAFGYAECPRLIRNAWIDAPAAPPVDTSCLDRIPPIDLGP